MIGLTLSLIASLVTFFGFIAQVGVYRRSAAISRAVGRLAITLAICTASLLGIALLYTIFDEVSTPSNFGGGQYGGYQPRSHDGFMYFVLGVLMPLAFGTVIILYHRLLAAGRIALQSEPAARNDD